MKDQRKIDALFINEMLTLLEPGGLEFMFEGYYRTHKSHHIHVTIRRSRLVGVVYEDSDGDICTRYMSQEDIDLISASIRTDFGLGGVELWET